MNILLGHLGSNGDCLYATAIAKQIKQDFPGCHLTFAICSLAKAVLKGNPDVDQIWEVKLHSWADMVPVWYAFEREAMRLHNEGVFDRVFLTQISPSRWSNYDGTIRPSVFRNYGRPVTVPVEATICLGEEERARVDTWIAAHLPVDTAFTVLFECSSKSGQSFVTPQWATEVAERVIARHPRAVFILSTADQIASENPRILSASSLTMLENARLTHSVDLFVGCGSGLTVVATSAAAKPNLPAIQVLRSGTSMYASFRHDFEYFGKPAERFLEITSDDPKLLADAISSSLTDGFGEAKRLYDDPVPLTFDWYLQLIRAHVVEYGAFADAASSLLVTGLRYGPVPQLRDFARREVLPFVKFDFRANSPGRQETMDHFYTLYRV